MDQQKTEEIAPLNMSTFDSKQIKAVVFDFDGTIANSEPAHLAAYNAVLRLHGIQIDFHEYKTKYLGHDDYDVFKLALKTDDHGIISSLVLQKSRAFISLTPKITFQEGFFEVLNKISTNHAVAICSAALRNDILQIFENNQANESISIFKAIVSADDVKHSKPDPEAYIKTCRLLNQSPDECLAIEDTPVGIQAARAAGLYCVGITHTVSEQQLNNANRVIHSLNEILEILDLT